MTRDLRSVSWRRAISPPHAVGLAALAPFVLALGAVTLAVPFTSSVRAQDAAASETAPTKRLTPELLWKLARVGAPQVSGDGRHVAFTVRTYELAKNKGVTQIHLLDLEANDAQPRVLTSGGSNFSPRWSPDSQSLAFLSTRDGAPQIYVLDLGKPGEARQVTTHEGGVANIAWSPTGQHFSFTASVTMEKSLHELYPDLPMTDAKVYEDLFVRRWDQWEDGDYTHVFVVPTSGGAARDLMEGMEVNTPLEPFGGGEQIAWAPDGKELCYTAKVVDEPQTSTDSSLYVVDIKSGAHRNVTEGLPGYDVEPVYSPDGRFLAWHSMERAGFEADRNRLMVMDRASGDRRDVLPDADFAVNGAIWRPDSLGFYFTSDTRGTTQVFRTDLEGGKAVPVTSGRWQFSGLSVGGRGSGVLVGLRCRTERPNEIVRLDPKGNGSGGTLTDINGPIFRELALPKVEERWTKATDGKDIHSWIVYPPDFDATKKWPMLLYCQGGPQGQVGQWFSFRWNFHLMASQGYVVVAVNRRGLPGFGREWNDQISKDWGGQAMADLLSVTDDMQSQPFIDRDRTGAVGASFGGYTVYWLMGNDDKNRFASMIAHCGVFNLESMYHATEELFFVNWDLGGPYYSNPETAKSYDKFSPHNFVGNWKTPLLVIHGGRDYRVPMTEGLQAFTAAQERGVPSKFLYFPEEGHWIQSPQNGVLWHRVFFDWLDRFCKTSDEAPASEAGKAPKDDAEQAKPAAAKPKADADGGEKSSPENAKQAGGGTVAPGPRVR